MNRSVMTRGVMERGGMRRGVMKRGVAKQDAMRRRNIMNGWAITGALLGAVVAIGLVINGRDLIRYLRINSM